MSYNAKSTVGPWPSSLSQTSAKHAYDAAPIKQEGSSNNPADNLLQRMTNIAERLDEANGRLEVIYTRLVGSYPKDAGNQVGAAPVPDGVFPTGHALLDRIESTVSRLLDRAIDIRTTVGA